MNTDTTMPGSFRAALDAALGRALLLDPRALDPLRDAAGFSSRASAEAPTQKKEPFTRNGDVAVVSISGPLAQRAWSCWMFEGDGYDAIAERVNVALNDRAVSAVVLRIDSPGGEVAGCFESARAIRAMAKASTKPIVAYADEQATSAAYALACACDEIVAPDTGIIGSIGVILSLTSVAGQLEQRGVAVNLIMSGSAKADGHPSIALSDDARARLQAEVDQLAQLFAGEVALTRPLDAKEVLALDAQIFIGAAAKRAGLVDHIGPFADAVARARALSNRTNRSGARSATTSRKTTMDENLLAALIAATGETDPAKQAAAVTNLKAKADASATSIEALTRDMAEANGRAEAAEKKLEATDRAREIEAAKAAGQWSPALDGFLGTLSIEQLRTWRTSAPRVVPGGEHQPPTDGPKPDAQLPADLAEIAAKAQTSGWASLSDKEKDRLYRANKPLAQRLKAAGSNPSADA